MANYQTLIKAVHAHGEKHDPSALVQVKLIRDMGDGVWVLYAIAYRTRSAFERTYKVTQVGAGLSVEEI